MKKNSILPIAEGVLRGFILTLIMLLIYAAVMCFVDTGDKANSIYYMITTLFSIMYGAIYAVRKLKKRGWIVGLIVSMLYMIILYAVFLIGNGENAILNQGNYIRILLAAGVGALSGMLGINL